MSPASPVDPPFAVDTARPLLRRSLSRTAPSGLGPLRIIALVAALVSLSVGCTPEESVTTYSIPTKIPEQLLPGEERLLAVMVPRDDKVWFFKILGPEKAVDSVAEEFRQFVGAIEFDSSDEPVIDGLPENWRRGAAKPMRFATIDINTDSKQLELAISNLGGPDEDWDAYVVQNVDRWRKQVGLEPSKEKWSGGEPIQLDGVNGEGVWVDLVGTPDPDGGTGMSGMAPFLSGGPMTSGGGPMTSGGGPMASGGVPESSPPPRGPALDYETPEGWTVGQSGGMREAAFTVGSDEEEAIVTVITAGGDLRSNVARWMQQVIGEAPSDQAVDEMLEGAEKFDIAGRPAQRFVIAGDADKGQTKSIDATIVPINETQSKFIKMTGTPGVVAEQSRAMKTFLESLSF